MIADEKDTQQLIIPTDVYQRIARDSAPGANLAMEIKADRFSEVMWPMKQINW